MSNVDIKSTYNKELEQEAFDLLSRVVWLIEQYPGWGTNGEFTFPDGEVWKEFKPDSKLTSTENISTFKGVII